MNKRIAKIIKQKEEPIKNQPLTRGQVAALPMGYTCTAQFPNNKERRQATKSVSRVGNNRKLTAGRIRYRAHRFGAVLNHK